MAEAVLVGDARERRRQHDHGEADRARRPPSGMPARRRETMRRRPARRSTARSCGVRLLALVALELLQHRADGSRQLCAIAEPTELLEQRRTWRARRRAPAADTGAMRTKNSTKSQPDRRPISRFCGSPTSVVTPPSAVPTAACMTMLRRNARKPSRSARVRLRHRAIVRLIVIAVVRVLARRHAVVDAVERRSRP